MCHYHFCQVSFSSFICCGMKLYQKLSRHGRVSETKGGILISGVVLPYAGVWFSGVKL